MGLVMPGWASSQARATRRADVDPRDVMRVMNGIWYLPDGPEWRDSVGKMLGLVIDGLRYGVPERGEAS